MKLNMLKKNCSYHLQQHFVAVCMNQQCTQLKLCCAKCLVFFHSDHSNSILFLDDILNSKNKLLKAWNCHKSIQSLMKYKHENQILEIQLQKLQDLLQKLMYQQIDNTKKQLRRQQLNLRFLIQQKIQSIKSQNRIGYEISHLQRIIKLFNKNMMNESQYFCQIEKIIKNREQMKSILQQKVKIPSLKLDKSLFQQKIQIIIKRLKQMNGIIKIPYTRFQFNKAKNINSKLISEIQKGKIFQFSQQSDYQIIYGPILKNQNVSFAIKIQVLEQQILQQYELKKCKKRTKKMQLQNQNQEQEQQEDKQVVQEILRNEKSAPIQNVPLLNYMQNINRQKYKFLKNLYVGIVNDECKNEQKSYQHQIVKTGRHLQLINQGYDIIQGTMIGGLLRAVAQYNINNPFNVMHKNMPAIFYQKMDSQDFELHFNWDGYNKFFYIQEKNKQAKLECTLGQHKHIYPLYDQYSNPIQLRPYICCNKSKVRVIIQEMETKYVEKTNTMQF